MNQPIITPVDTELIEKELTPDKFLRPTNKGGNHIYVVDAHEAPNTMREVGRLREIAFRMAGGGTGKNCDIDEFDLMATPCKQMIVWNPEHRMILGGYRYIVGADVTLKPDGQPMIATSHMFHFSDRFIREFLPNTLELGRSFVRLELQSTRQGSQSIYVLDNLWDGLGALTVKHPEIKYLFGKVTMYPDYSSECRNMILHFLNKYFPDPDRLIYPITPLDTKANDEEIEQLFQAGNFKDDYRTLNAKVRELGYNIPPLVNAYMSLSPKMKMFGTAINYEFGDVEESGIFMAIDDIFEEKKRRHIESFRESEPLSLHNL